jgi:hypothetical protein
MRKWLRLAALLLLAGCVCLPQELEPRAYSISPVGVNFAVLGFSRSSGAISFDPNLPVEDGNATLHATVLAYGRSFGVLGRSANVVVTAPYVWGPLQGRFDGQYVSARRSGLAPPAARVAVNLFGGPAMGLEDFIRWRRKTVIGASFAFVPPLGQYDSKRLVNISSNRWAFKPELGLSRRFDRWFVDVYLGAWLFTANPDLQGKVRRQDPIGSSQLHISYNIRPRLWAAFDANFYVGGRTSMDGVRRFDLQRNSRVGGTLAVPLTRRQSLKCSVSSGAKTTIGAAFTSLSVGYQVMWGGGL